MKNLINKKTVKVDETEYLITPIPIEYNPYFNQITRLLKVTVDTEKEAEENTAKLKHAVKMILDATVQPAPPIEHQNYLYNLVVSFTNIVMTEAVSQAELFRSQPKPANKKSS